MVETFAELNERAERSLRLGQLEHAQLAYRRLLDLYPDTPNAWYNLGYVQRCLRQFEDALASYRQAVDGGIAHPEAVHVNRAAILSEHLERTQDARAELEEALRLNPDFVIAWLNLGNLLEDFGDHSGARQAYAEALVREPNNGRALARSAMLDIMAGQAEGVAAALPGVLLAPELGREDAAEIGFALGSALDATGQYDAAFEAVARANNQMATLAGAADRYDPDAHERLIDRIILAFPRAASPGPEPVRSDPIFICGMFRSGSTLAEQILARHSRITAGGELEFVPAMVAHQLQPFPEAGAAASSALIAELRSRYHDELRVIYPDADIVTDKRPDNFLYLGLIKRLFPAARIVHTVRHPLDNLLSIYFLPFGRGVRYGWSLEAAAHWYCQYRRLMAHWRMLYADSIFDFDYDQVVANPRPSIERLLAFCGLDWQEDCLALPPARTPVRTASAWQVRQPLHRRSSGRWRHYAHQLEGARLILQDCDAELGNG